MQNLPEDIQPVNASDADIRAALEEAHIPALMAAMVHLTGSVDHLQGDIRPKVSVFGDDQGDLSEDQKARARDHAFGIIKAFRDSGCQLPTPPDNGAIQTIMEFMTGGDAPPEYAPYLKDELKLYGDTDAATGFSAEAIASAKKNFKVVVIGSGMSGILAGIRLQQAGIPYQIIEKNPKIGGTWHENTYPGCRVDSPNHLYSYSFEPYDWPQYYSQHGTLYAYFKECADKYGVTEHIRFNTEVDRAAYNNDTGQWAVTIRDQDGSTETLHAGAVISAVGQLNRPLFPEIEDRDSFGGDAFHSGGWNHDVDLKGKKVAVVGTGASAFQFVPEVAKEAGELLVFQRSPAWMGASPNYHDDIVDGVKWLMNHVPFYRKWYRFWLFWMATDGLIPNVRVDPSWNYKNYSVSASNDELRVMMTDYIAEQVGDDADLLAKAIPDYPVGGKRSLRDNGSWLGALKQDHVHVVTDHIASINEAGLMTEDGTQHDVDVIIYGTGFQANKFLWPMEIVGKSGTSLEEKWAGEPRAYLGITVPDFPNLFCLYGPNTNIVVNGSIIFFAESAMHYVMECLREVLQRGGASMDIKQDAHDKFYEWVDHENENLAWGIPEVNSWYKNASGRVTQNWSGTLLDYWQLTRQPNIDDYNFSTGGSA